MTNNSQANFDWIMKNGSRNFLLTLAIIASITIVLLIGFFNYHYEINRYLMLGRSIEMLTDKQSLNTLKGDSDDVKNPNYQKIKEVYNNINNVNSNTRFIYILGQEEGLTYFYLDSQPSRFKNILDSSYPGDLYSGPTQYVNKVFSDNETITAGPYSNQWGMFMSILTPINNADGKVNMVLGVDFDIASWTEDVRILPIFITIALIAAITIDLIQRKPVKTKPDKKINTYPIKRFPFKISSTLSVSSFFGLNPCLIV